MDNNYNFKVLIGKYHRGECSEKEKSAVESWLLAELQKDLPSPSHENIESADNRMSEVIQAHIGRHHTIVRLWPRIVTVPAAIALIVMGVYFFNYNKGASDKNSNLLTQDVAPGRQGATLTLANGKKIRLTDAANGELANEAGVVISKSADGRLVYEIKGADGNPNKINTLSTAKGETYQVRLPDGSLVWLNAASSLIYAANLNERGKRRVKLDGEAYFQIAKDKSHPFIVETSRQQVEVLGTHFNINSYADEPAVTTTLEEGSVKVDSRGLIRILKPGQQSVITTDNMTVRSVKVENVVAWKDGAFLFEEESLGSIMRKVSRWYDVEVIYEKVDQNELYGGGVSRYDKVTKVLENLELTGGLHFKIEGRTITVMK